MTDQTAEKDARWLDGQIENERYRIERGYGSRDLLRFLQRQRDALAASCPIPSGVSQ